MKTIEVNGVKYQEIVQDDLSKIVLIRTYSAGIHFGTVKNACGTEVTLMNARRLWKWGGAFTLNEIANNGVDLSKSKISESVRVITLTQAIEIIPMTISAAKLLMEAEPCKV